jgi:hypothetical protein
MRSSVAEPRFIDSVDDESDRLPGIPAHDEEEVEPPISDLAAPQSRYCPKLARSCGRNAYYLTEW